MNRSLSGELKLSSYSDTMATSPQARGMDSAIPSGGDGSESSTETHFSSSVLYEDEEKCIEASDISEGSTTPKTTLASPSASKEGRRKERKKSSKKKKESFADEFTEDTDQDHLEDWRTWRETWCVLVCIIVLVVSLILIHKSGIVPQLNSVSTEEEDALGNDSLSQSEPNQNTPTTDIFD